MNLRSMNGVGTFKRPFFLMHFLSAVPASLKWLSENALSLKTLPRLLNAPQSVGCMYHNALSIFSLPRSYFLNFGKVFMYFLMLFRTDLNAATGFFMTVRAPLIADFAQSKAWPP